MPETRRGEQSGARTTEHGGFLNGEWCKCKNMHPGSGVFLTSHVKDGTILSCSLRSRSTGPETAGTKLCAHKKRKKPACHPNRKRKRTQRERERERERG